MDNLILYSSKVFLSESEENPDIFLAKFVICDFSTNGNGVALNRDTIESWMPTLKNKPLVGKIKMRSDGELDFSGHNVKVIEKIDENGKKYKDIEFDTDAFGTFTEVSIELIDKVEYIVATAEIWKRFTRACEIIEKRVAEGTLHTSWEIAVTDSIKQLLNGTTQKLVNVGRFIGHCMLGRDIIPAYQSSGLLEIASSDEDTEISEALSKDIIESFNINVTEKEDTRLAKNKTVEVSEEIIDVETPTEQLEETSETNDVVDANSEETNVTENSELDSENIEQSALTERDLRDKIREACRTKLGSWCWISYHFPVDRVVWVEKDNRESELDYLLFTYEVIDDVVAVSEPQEVKLTVGISEINSKLETMQSEISTKNEAIVKASEEIQSLKVQVSELLPFKEMVDQAEQERVANEIAEKKLNFISKYKKSPLVTSEEFDTSEEIKGYVETLNEKDMNDLIATRYMASLDQEVVEMSEVNIKKKNETNASINLVDDDITDDKISVMKKFLRK
jgi:hypothetical protein